MELWFFKGGELCFFKGGKPFFFLGRGTSLFFGTAQKHVNERQTCKSDSDIFCLYSCCDIQHLDIAVEVTSGRTFASRAGVRGESR